MANSIPIGIIKKKNLRCKFILYPKEDPNEF